MVNFEFIKSWDCIDTIDFYEEFECFSLMCETTELFRWENRNWGLLIVNCLTGEKFVITEEFKGTFEQYQTYIWGLYINEEGIRL